MSKLAIQTRVAIAGAMSAFSLAAACGLSTAGSGTGDASDASNGAGNSDSAAIDGTTTIPIDAPDSPDGSSTDAGSASDAAVDAPIDAGKCAPSFGDGGVVGLIPLNFLSLKGNAKYSENSDNKITLTDPQNFQAGAAWTPQPSPVYATYAISFDLSVPSGTTPGDGISFAIFEGSMPNVGNNGNGIGLEGISNTGYAVVVDMYKSDPTDDDVTTLKFVTMPGFNIVAHAGLSDRLDDGNPHGVDVSFDGTTLHATLHGPTKDTTLDLANPGFLLTTPPFLGFTGATGGGDNAHNEIVDFTIKSACY